MNFQTVTDWRNKRNLLNHNLHPYNPMHYSIANYSSQEKHNEMDSAFSDINFLNNLYMIPDPLQKNLADTLVNNGENKKMGTQIKESYQNNKESGTKAHSNGTYPYLMGLGNFISNAINAISGFVSLGRDKTQPDHEGSTALENWQSPKIEELNKSEQNAEQFNANIDQGDTCDLSKMNVDCRTAVAHCEDKLNKVRSLLTNKTTTSPKKCHRKRPRKVFVEPSSVEESFEDAFSPEDLARLENDKHMECFSAINVQNPEMVNVELPKIKTESSVQENVNTIMEIEETEASSEVSSGVENMTVAKEQLVSSCEDKVSHLKALLKQRRKTNTKTSVNSSDSVQEPVKEDRVNDRPKNMSKSIPMPKVHDKHYKNRQRLNVDKRQKNRLRKNIQDDMSFAAEVDFDDVSSDENLPVIKISPPVLKNPTLDSESVLEEGDSFNEITGRFTSTPTDSEDSFQIVFSDTPTSPRTRKPSDCDSEDSFIVFEGSPDDCYTNSDVFGEHVSESEESADESSDSDSDCDDTEQRTVAMSNSLSKSCGDLTDDSLYQDEVKCEDQVDCAFRVGLEMPPEEVQDFGVEEKALGVLLNATRKRQKQSEPPKRVHFSPHPPKVRVMCVWAFAARQARAGHWERHTIDRQRFKRRIEDVEMAISWVLKPQHRTRVMFQRFMPWWNAQKRQEIAEKKQKEEMLRREAEETELNDADGKQKEENVGRDTEETPGAEETKVKDVENKEEKELRAEAKESLNAEETQLKDSNISNNVTDKEADEESRDKKSMHDRIRIVNVKNDFKHTICNNTNVKTVVQTNLDIDNTNFDRDLTKTNDLSEIVDVHKDLLDINKRTRVPM